MNPKKLLFCWPRSRGEGSYFFFLAGAFFFAGAFAAFFVAFFID